MTFPATETEPSAPPVPEQVSIPDAPKPIDNTKVADRLKQQIETAKKHRRQYSGRWKRNIETRLGNDPENYTDSVYYSPGGMDERQSLVNPDWSLTKTKTANLYSQVPQVQGTHENTQYAPAVSPFMKELNYQLGEKGANVAPPMEEALNDVVNASGIAAVIVGYAARTEKANVPAIDVSRIPPDRLQEAIDSGLIPMQPTDRVVDSKFFTTRISPGDFLHPKPFKGSNFDDANWLGYTGRLPWAVAKPEFKLSDDQKSEVVGAAEYSSQDDLRSSMDRPDEVGDETVTFDELYYWRYRVDPDELSFSAIWKIVFVHGIEEPVVHEPWKGQKYDKQTRTYVGSCKFPIRVLTLTYISDHAIPPSDTAAGRPQVRDLQRSRSQMLNSRDRNRPVNWHDVNRIGKTIQESLMRGTWMGSIPTNGDGSRALGQIARASFPSENFRFDEMTKADLMESWQIGPNQSSQMTGGTATESKNVQANFATRIGQERGRVASFFLGIAEVLAGWVALYGSFKSLSQEERQRMDQAWDRGHILHDLVLKIRPDSAIVLDTNSQIDRLTKFLNITGKSGAINIQPVIAEIAELSGLDPMAVMKKPEPPPPEEPNISLRLSGKDDLINPLVMAMLILLKKAPTIEGIAQAKTILEAAAASPPPQPPVAPGAGGPVAAPGANSPVPSLEVPHPPPDWGLMDHVAKRSRDIGGG